MRRAEERERQRRESMTRTHRVLVTWELKFGDWFVNFLDPHSRLPVGRQHVFYSADTLRGLVDRSLTQAKGGPRQILFNKDLEAGKGEIEIEVTAEQFAGIKRAVQ